MKILIIGGGIGGLAAALALLRAGFDARVYEQAPALGEVGAGLTLSRGALACCAHLGIAEAVHSSLALATGFSYLHYQSGAVLVAAPPPAASHPKDVQGGHIYRPDFHGILVAAVRRYGQDRILLGHRLAGITQDAAGVTATFADGASAQGEVLIGADGVRSAVRAAVFDAEQPEFTGKIAFRFMLPVDQAGDFRLLGGPACLFVGRGRVFNRYLVSQGRLLNCVGLLACEGWAEDGWNTPATAEELLGHYEGWHPAVRSLMARAPEGKLIKWGIFARPPRDIWVQGRVALLGDAAHPMQPFLGLGAAMAVEDATILGRAFAEHADIDAALAAYARLRMPRANKVMMLSKLQGDLFDTTDPADYPPRHAPSHDPSVGVFDPLVGWGEEAVLF
jgi:salicylate hydroxylase